MTPEEYIDSLEDQDLIDLETMINDYATLRLRLNQPRTDEVEAIKNVDVVIQDAPKTTKPMFLYKQYKADPELRLGGILEELGYLYGSTKNPGVQSGIDLISIEIPSGTPVLKLSPDAYVLPRGLKIKMEPAAGGIISGVLQ